MATDEQRAGSTGGRGRTPPEWTKPRLTAVQREEIRQRLADGENATALAAEYGVSRGAINNYR